MSVHTCPRCELRFSYRAEVADHLFADHHVGELALAGVGSPVGGVVHRAAPNPLRGGNVMS